MKNNLCKIKLEVRMTHLWL